MKIAFYGSSLLSSYWNGAATYYRGMLADLARRGHRITFYEPDAFDRQSHRDIDPPDWAEVQVYPATIEAARAAIAQAAEADVVVKASGVGVFDDELLEGVVAAARPDAIRIFWDVDAPATLAEMRANPDHALHRAMPALDLVLTYGGGPPVIAAYEGFGARACIPVYNALDAETHHPVPPDPRFSADLAFLGNRLPDREARVERFFLAAAARLPERSFLLGGSGWESRGLPLNVRHLGHVSTRDHNAFNVTPAPFSTSPATAWRRSASRPPPACSRRRARAPASSPTPGKASACSSSRVRRCSSPVTGATSPTTSLR